MTDRASSHDGHGSVNSAARVRRHRGLPDGRSHRSRRSLRVGSERRNSRRTGARNRHRRSARHRARDSRRARARPRDARGRRRGQRRARRAGARRGARDGARGGVRGRRRARHRDRGGRGDVGAGGEPGGGVRVVLGALVLGHGGDGGRLCLCVGGGGPHCGRRDGRRRAGRHGGRLVARVAGGLA